MKRLLSAFVVLSTACFGNVVFAADHWHTSTIRLLYPMGDGSFAIIFHTDQPNCTASAPKYHYVTVGQNGVTREGANKLYAAALMAKASERPISIVFSDSTTYCYINRLTIE